jgi:hypothetical protein
MRHIPLNVKASLRNGRLILGPSSPLAYIIPKPRPRLDIYERVLTATYLTLPENHTDYLHRTKRFVRYMFIG